MQSALLEKDFPFSTFNRHSSVWKAELRSLVKGEWMENEVLARYTTVKVGGPADVLFFPSSIEDLMIAIQFCKKNQVPCFILGNGSNLLIRDEGIRGLVIRLHRCLNTFKVEKEEVNEVWIRAEAGLATPKLVEYCRQQGYSGIESLYGIPGTVGGAIVMNAGTREGEIGEVVEELAVLDASGEVKVYPKKKLHFEYRDLDIPRSEIVLHVLLKLKKSTSEEVSNKLSFFQKRRHETQPLDQANMGSVFKNPPKKFAAQIIEELGLKGVRVGGARLSDKHSNWIVNEGGATAKDILALIGLIKDKVKEASGIKLETEVKIVGEK